MLFIYIIIIVVSCSLCVWALKKPLNKRSVIDFGKYLKKTGIPIITLKEGDIELNFLLDTGSSESHLSRAASSLVIGTPIETDYVCINASGQSNTQAMVEVCLTHEGKEYPFNMFILEDLDSTFKQIFENDGVQIHGILGSDFITKYKGILDCKSSILYLNN